MPNTDSRVADSSATRNGSSWFNHLQRSVSCELDYRMTMCSQEERMEENKPASCIMYCFGIHLERPWKVAPNQYILIPTITPVIVTDVCIFFLAFALPQICPPSLFSPYFSFSPSSCLSSFFCVNIRLPDTRQNGAKTCIPPLTVNSVYTWCHRRNGPNFGRVFLMLNYTDITQNTYVQS